MLIATEEIKNKCENVSNRIIERLIEFFDSDTIFLQKIILLLSDVAPYALKARRTLKGFIPAMKHVTCICHALHDLSETERDNFPNVDKIVVFFKKSLIKNKEKKSLFIKTTGLILPNFPIITRWGTWLRFVKWTFENYLKFIEKLIENFPTVTNNEIKNLFDSKEFEIDIGFIYSFKFISTSIQKLKGEYLSVEQQMKVLAYFEIQLKDKEVYFTEFKAILERNPDISFFREFNTLRSQEYEKYYSFVPLTTLKIERSFSHYRDVLNEKKTRLTMKNLEMHFLFTIMLLNKHFLHNYAMFLV